MGNRSFLYVVPADGSDGGTEIAEANNNFPVLWQLMLAEGAAAPAITDQRVFGDAGTDNLAADAETALERLRLLAEFLREHPRLHEQPLLTLQFEALLAHLREAVDAVRGAEGGAVLFSANLDELSWLDGDGSPDEFLRQCRSDCGERWNRVRSAIREGRHALLDEALGLNEYGRGFAAWEAWAWEFGFAGLHHDYFSLRDEPRDVAFADFRPEPRAWDDELGDGFVRFERGGRWGVAWRSAAGGAEREVLAPEWEAIEHATDGAVWVVRDGLYGYAGLGAEGMAIDVPPQLEEVWEFREDAEEGNPHCAIVRRGDRYGLLGADGRWLVEPAVDELWEYAFGYAPFRQGEREGYIDRAGRIAIAAEFDRVAGFSRAGVAAVWRGGRAGLVRGDGQLVLEPTYDELEWREDFRAYLATLNGKLGLVRADGSVWIAPQWDEIQILLTRCSIGTRRGDLWGVHDWEGRERVAPRYTALETRFYDNLGDDEASFAQLQPWHRQLFARVRGDVGLIDEDGRELVPIAYDKVESFEPQVIAGSEPVLQPELVCIVKRGPKRSKLRGVYDVAQGRELVPCEWNHVYPASFGGGEWGFLVSRDVPKGQRDRLGDCRTGVLRADGSVLYAAQYAWIATRMSLSGSLWAVGMVRAKLAEAWGAGQPVQAVGNEDGQYVWLHRDGRIEPHMDYLTRRYEQEGDLGAALQLGRALRDGEGVPQDEKLARHWLWLATGAETVMDAAPIWRGIFGKLLDGPASDGSIQDPQPSKRPRNWRAMYELALMLQGEAGGFEQPGTARKWLEFALEQGGQEDGDVLAELGYVLSEGVGGPVDRQRAHALYERAIAQDSKVALHNLALAYQYGWEVAPDLDRALDYFRRAERLGDASCAYHVGAVLAEQARGLDGAARREKLSEAAYALSSVMYGDTRHSAAACAEHARICLDPDAKEYSVARAEELLLRGAEADDLESIELLVDALYGKADSGLADGEKAAHWAARKAALEATDD